MTVAFFISIPFIMCVIELESKLKQQIESIVAKYPDFWADDFRLTGTDSIILDATLRRLEAIQQRQHERAI